MEERSARRSLLHFFCPTAFPSLVIAVSLVSSSSPAGSSPPMPPPSVVHGVLRVGVGAHVLSSATWEAGERPRWGKSRTPPAAPAICRGRLRLDRVVRTPPALRGSPNAPWESPPLAKRLHTVAVAHRPAVQWNEKAIYVDRAQSLGSVLTRTCPATAGQLAERTAAPNSGASAPSFSSYRQSRTHLGAFANLQPHPAPTRNQTPQRPSCRPL